MHTPHLSSFFLFHIIPRIKINVRPLSVGFPIETHSLVFECKNRLIVQLFGLMDIFVCVCVCIYRPVNLFVYFHLCCLFVCWRFLPFFFFTIINCVPYSDIDWSSFNDLSTDLPPSYSPNEISYT